MVQIGKYALLLIGFFLAMNVLVWGKYVISPEEKTGKFERRLSFEEATNDLKGHIDYKNKNYYYGGSYVVKVSAARFLEYRYDTLTSESSYYSRDKE